MPRLKSIRVVLRPSWRLVIRPVATLAVIGLLPLQYVVVRTLLRECLPQLAVLLTRRGRFTLRNRARAWKLYRRAAQGRNLASSEWDEILAFIREGLLHEHERHRPYRVNGFVVWHERLAAL